MSKLSEVLATVALRGGIEQNRNLILGRAGQLLHRLAPVLARPPILSWEAPIQPKALQRSRVVFSGERVRAYNDRDDEQYRQDLRRLWMATPNVNDHHYPLAGELVTVMTFAGNARPKGSRARRRRPDWTNLVKAVEDAGSPSRDGGWMGLWKDDSQIILGLGAIVAWDVGVEPRVTLDVWTVPE